MALDCSSCCDVVTAVHVAVIDEDENKQIRKAKEEVFVKYSGI